MATKWDVVWYWVGGEEVGEWREAFPGADIDETVRGIERGGRVAVKGLLSIGAPEGAPSPDALRSVLNPRVPYIEVDKETVVDHTTRLSFSVRVF
jgi:hypothetical protein